MVVRRSCSVVVLAAGLALSGCASGGDAPLEGVIEESRYSCSDGSFFRFRATDSGEILWSRDDGDFTGLPTSSAFEFAEALTPLLNECPGAELVSGRDVLLVMAEHVAFDAIAPEDLVPTE